MLAGIRFYQAALAPLMPFGCKFYPSCSHYAAEAIATHGVLKGTGLALMRVLRCHPWGGAGYDPVPDRVAWSCRHHHHLST